VFEFWTELLKDLYIKDTHFFTGNVRDVLKTLDGRQCKGGPRFQGAQNFVVEKGNEN